MGKDFYETFPCAKEMIDLAEKVSGIPMKELLFEENENINISEESIRKGLIETKWPGRIEKIKENPMFIIDGAHNEEGAMSLAKSIDKYLECKITIK